MTKREADVERFDLFISYATDPDFGFARKLESFLETFHKIRSSSDIALKPLRICRDGSDFHAAAREGTGPTLEQYLERSNELLVLCSARARSSRWVDAEINWFLEHRGAGSIRVATTEGARLRTLAADVFPPALIDAGLHNGIAYDFRGRDSRASATCESVRPLDDELVRLAADLNGRSLGEVQPIWLREQREQTRRKLWLVTAAAIALLALAVVALVERQVAVRETERAERSLAETKVALAGSYFREAITRVEDGRQFEALAFAGRAVALDPTLEAARSLALNLLLWKPWPRVSIRVNSAVPPVALSSDGGLMLIGSDEGASLIDVRSGAAKMRLPANGSPITAVALTRDGAIAATGDQQGRVGVWAIGTGSSMMHQWSLSARVTALAFSADGERLAAGGAGTQVWNVRDGKAAGPRLDRGWVNATEFARNGAWLLVQGESGRTQIWNYERGVQIGKPVEAGPTFGSASLDDTGRLLMTGSYGAPSSARIWDVQDGHAITKPLVLADFPIKGRVLDDRHALIVSRDGSARVWDYRDEAAPTRVEFTHGSALWTAAISDDGLWVATGATDGTVRVWDRRAAIRLPATLPARMADAGGLSANGAFAAAASGSEVWIARLATDSADRIPLPPSAQSIAQHVAVRDDGRQIALTMSGGRVWLLDPSAAAPISVASRRQETGLVEDRARTLGLFYGAGGRFLANVYGQFADIVDTTSGHFVGRQLSHGDIMRTAGFSADGGRVVTSSRDGSARVWNANTGEPQTPPLRHGEAIVASAFTGDGRRVITASRDGLLTTWDLQSLQQVARVPLRGVALIGDAAFSADAARVATTNYSDTLRVWDTRTGLPLTESLGQHAPVHVGLSDDGTRLLAVDNSVAVWDVPAVAAADAAVLARWSEAVAGVRVADSGALVALDSASVQLADLRRESESSSFHRGAIWTMVRWFFLDPSKRAISPMAAVTIDASVLRVNSTPTR
jgi:WD40 repeat protein